MIKILYADHKDCCLCLSLFIKTSRCIWDPQDLLGVIYMATAGSRGSKANIPMAQEPPTPILLVEAPLPSHSHIGVSLL